MTNNTSLLMPVLHTTYAANALTTGMVVWHFNKVPEKGSHHIFVHPTKPGHISVPHPKKDLGVGLLHKLFKQSGLS